MSTPQMLRPGRYRHFKGKEYELLFVATHSETLEPMVVYRALYGEHGHLGAPRRHVGRADRARRAGRTPLYLHRGLSFRRKKCAGSCDPARSASVFK